MRVRNESAVNFPAAFDETMYPPSTKYWFFFYTLPPRIWWHNGECTVGRLSEYRRKMYNCLKFKCRCCCDRSDQPLLMYRVSSCCCVVYIIGRIIDSYIRFSRNLHACVAAGLEMRWIIAIWLMHERSRIVETAHICKCLSMHLRSELFIFKTMSSK